MNRAFLIITIGIVLNVMVSCDDDERPELTSIYTIEGPQGMRIDRFERISDELYALTEKGIYTKSIQSDSDWKLLGLAHVNVSGFVKIDDLFLASSREEIDGIYPIYLSADGGKVWEVFSDGIGIDGVEPALALHYNEGNKMLYASSFGVVAQSNDYGVTWMAIAGDFQSFGTGIDNLEIINEVLYAGGQNAIEELVLYRIDIAASESTCFKRLIPSPGVAVNTVSDPINKDRILIGCEGGVIESLDNGKNWSVLHKAEASTFYNALELDKDNSSTLYAFVWNKTGDLPQPLVYLQSIDGGQNWEEFVVNDDSGFFGGVMDAISVETGGKQEFYLALDKGGIVKIRIN